MATRKPHAPEPLQVPVAHPNATVPCWSGHSPAGSPERILEHVPTVPVRLHALHVPEHEILQHTPSTQFSCRHCVPTVQLSPSAFSDAVQSVSGGFVHPVGQQLFPLEQLQSGSCVPEQPVGHVPLHPSGTQTGGVPLQPVHFPLPRIVAVFV